MSGGGVRGIDLFKIAGESISGWIPSWKTGEIRPTRQPFCSLMEERLLLYLEYHPQVAWYGRADISSTFAWTYKITTPLPTPYTIDYLFEGNAHVYLPDAIGQLQGGSLLIAEAGLEREKRRERNQAKAEAARKVADDLGGVYWIGTEATLLPQRHANLVFLHARRQPFPSFQELAEALEMVWPYALSPTHFSDQKTCIRKQYVYHKSRTSIHLWCDARASNWPNEPLGLRLAFSPFEQAESAGRVGPNARVPCRGGRHGQSDGDGRAPYTLSLNVPPTTRLKRAPSDSD